MFRYSIAILVTLAVLSTATTSFACPSGYVPCGQTSQLCCPG